MHKFAVIAFPGTNSETEAVRAFKRNGMDAEIVLWNDPGMLDRSRLSEFAGYCIAGGFSYEDRGRSGVIAAQEPITEILKEEADQGKVILGICNGAQILVETGLVPGFEDKSLGVALAWNEMKAGGQVIDTGFYCNWAYLKNDAPQGRSAFNNFDELLHIPFAHGEGRFVMGKELLEKMAENGQILYKYCDKNGTVDENFPTTPNGAMASAAAICNPAGNVMAIMPHPERDPKGNGNLVFQSIKNYLENKPKIEYKTLAKPIQLEGAPSPALSFDIEIFVRLIITDNTERTIEETLRRKGMEVALERYEFYGLNLNSGVDLNYALKKLMESGEIANFNKQRVFLKINNEFFTYDLEKGLIPTSKSLESYVVIFEQGDQLNVAKKKALNDHAEECLLKLDYGVFWSLKNPAPGVMDQVIASKILHNPYSMNYVAHAK